MDNFELLDELSEKISSVSDYKADSQTKESIEMLRSSGILSRFVRENEGKWDHNEWLLLLGKIRSMGYRDISEDAIGRAVELEKQLFHAELNKNNKNKFSANSETRAIENRMNKLADTIELLNKNKKILEKKNHK